MPGIGIHSYAFLDAFQFSSGLGTVGIPIFPIIKICLGIQQTGTILLIKDFGLQINQALLLPYRFPQSFRLDLSIAGNF